MLAAAVAGKTVFSFLAMAAGVFTLFFSAAAGFCGRKFLRDLRRRPTSGVLPPISVIKPLKGQEDFLYENLAGFCRQDYPAYQLIFCAQDPEDPALRTVSRLQADFPDADIEVVVSHSRIGYNPKVNNMANAYPLAKHDLILMSDSDIAAPPDFLRRMAAPFADPQVGLVTAFYEAAGVDGLWDRLEALSINAQFLPQGLCAAFFGMRFAMGAGMMVRRRAFEETGGFHNLADHLADDFWLGESICAAGWKLEFADTVVGTVSHIRDGASHVKHLVRWSRTIRICQPVGHAASLIQHGFSLLTLKILLFGPDPVSVALLLAIWGAKAASGAFIRADLDGRRPADAYWLLPLAEWFSFAAWIGGYGSSRVHWRGEEFDVASQGRLIPVTAPPRPVPVP